MGPSRPAARSLLAGNGSMGGTITIKAPSGTLTINNNSAIPADGGAGGNQSGKGGKGGNSAGGTGGNGGDVRKQGDGGNGGTITIEAKIRPSNIPATVNGGAKGAQNGMAGFGGTGMPAGMDGAVDRTSAKDGQAGSIFPPPP